MTTFFAPPIPWKSRVKEFDRNTLTCGFCGRTQHEVDYLITGFRIFVCGDCVEDCAKALADIRGDQLDEIRRLGT